MVFQGENVAMPTEGDVVIEAPSFHDDLDHLYCGKQLTVVEQIAQCHIFQVV